MGNRKKKFNGSAIKAGGKGRSIMEKGTFFLAAKVSMAFKLEGRGFSV